jgi:hypothetical protein
MNFGRYRFGLCFVHNKKLCSVMTSDSVDALKKHFKINKFNRTMYFVDGLTAKVVGVAS